MGLVLWQQCQDGCSESDKIKLREFRYHPNPRGRFMARDLDHNDQQWQWSTIGAEHWTDYDIPMPNGDFDVTFDPNDAPVATEQMRHLEGFGLPAQQTVGTGATQYLHGDLIRSTMLTTGQGGTAMSAVSYTAFGELIGSAPETRYQYAGGWGYESDLLVLEGAPGTAPITLQHVGHRWYDPSIGRFIQRDPLGLRGGSINVYTYGHNAPTITVDRDGQLFWFVVAVVGGVLAAKAIYELVVHYDAVSNNPRPDPTARPEGGRDPRLDVLADCIPVLKAAAKFPGTSGGGLPPFTGPTTPSPIPRPAGGPPGGWRPPWWWGPGQWMAVY
ncbi:MAG TPA: RHS repeat-associated core domain-containing protein [Phycisphaerae bacterium]|nr:RHS repeat-associated core domain-containing protein [Phycisphaerae bacterium]